jgi:hypothetical protein
MYMCVCGPLNPKPSVVSRPLSGLALGLALCLGQGLGPELQGMYVCGIFCKFRNHILESPLKGFKPFVSSLNTPRCSPLNPKPSA